MEVAAFVQKTLQAGEVGADLLRMGGAYLHALPAGDTALGYHGSLAVDYPDGLAMTVTDTLVAVLALILNGIDRLKHLSLRIVPSATTKKQAMNWKCI